MLYLLNPFHGRISRGRWWLSQAAIIALACAGIFLTILLFSDPSAERGTRAVVENLMQNLIIAMVIYMNFSTCLNRLRGSGRSRLWYLTFLSPIAGSGLMIYFCGIDAGDDRSRFSRVDDLRRDRLLAQRETRQNRQAFGRRS